MTITSEVTGAITLPLDETDYTYPRLEIKSLKIRPRVEALPYRYAPYMGSYWRPYWGGHRYWR